MKYKKNIKQIKRMDFFLLCDTERYRNFKTDDEYFIKLCA